MTLDSPAGPQLARVLPAATPDSRSAATTVCRPSPPRTPPHQSPAVSLDGCNSYYLTEGGACAYCGEGVSACADGNGTATECNSSFRLADSACVPCELPCRLVGGGRQGGGLRALVLRARARASARWLCADGRASKPRSPAGLRHLAQPLPAWPGPAGEVPDCRDCSGDPSTCLECAFGRYWNGSACAECLPPGCLTCTADGQRCVDCLGDSKPDAQGACPTGSDPGCSYYEAAGKCGLW